MLMASLPFLIHNIASSLCLLSNLFFSQGFILIVDQRPFVALDNFEPLASV